MLYCGTTWKISLSDNVVQRLFHCHQIKM